MAGRLDGKVALITGAARGQGEAEARLFVAEGARVVVTDMLDELGEKVAASLGDAAVYRHLDVSSEADWDAAVKLTRERFGRLDILVNNAGINGTWGPIESCTLENYRLVTDVNQLGPFLGMKAVIPSLRESGTGSIVNVSSVAGLHGIPGLIAYVASKFALRGMTKVAAMELGKHNIRVNSVHPGAVDTPMMPPEVDRVQAAKGQPLERVGQPEELARMVLFLASEESSFCTGSEFIADGGMSAGQVREEIDH